MIPKHILYTEAFFGGGAVFFAKEPVKCEIVNDTNAELINFYRVVKSNFNDLESKIKETIHSRDVHRQARHISSCPSFFDPINRAWATWVCSKMSFASMLNGTFGYDRNGTTALKILNAKSNFTQELCDRLNRTTIENEDGIKVISRYDCDSAFHFVDPPYIGSDCGHYSGSFNSENLSELLTVLSTIKGKFMLTMFPNELIREFSNKHGWTIHVIERTISASIKNRRKQEEWIVVNYTV